MAQHALEGADEVSLRGSEEDFGDADAGAKEAGVTIYGSGEGSFSLRGPAVEKLAAAGLQVGEVLVDHPPIGIDGAQPVAQRRPAIAVGVDDLLPGDERALVQERPAAAGVSSGVEEVAVADQGGVGG